MWDSHPIDFVREVPLVDSDLEPLDRSTSSHDPEGVIGPGGWCIAVAALEDKQSEPSVFPKQQGGILDGINGVRHSGLVGDSMASANALKRKTFG